MRQERDGGERESECTMGLWFQWNKLCYDYKDTGFQLSLEVNLQEENKEKEKKLKKQKTIMKFTYDGNFACFS